MTFSFVVPLQPCCVVLYLPWWQILFELLQGSQSPLSVCPPHGGVVFSFVLFLVHRHALGRSLEGEHHSRKSASPWSGDEA